MFLPSQNILSVPYPHLQAKQTPIHFPPALSLFFIIFVLVDLGFEDKHFILNRVLFYMQGWAELLFSVGGRFFP